MEFVSSFKWPFLLTRLFHDRLTTITQARQKSLQPLAVLEPIGCLYALGSLKPHASLKFVRRQRSLKPLASLKVLS